MSIIPWRNKGNDQALTPAGTDAPSRSDFDRMVARFFDEPWGKWPFGGAPQGWDVTGFLPSVDVTETDDDVLVRAELPGLDAKDIDLAVEQDVLTITGEKKARAEQRSESVFHSERRFGRFRRSLRLPFRVDAGKVSASYEAGILTVRLPRSEEARPRRIEVKAGR